MKFGLHERLWLETYGVQIVFIACHMDPISPDVRELSHRDIQPVETKMDGHHLGPSSISPQYYAAWLLNYLFVVTFPTQPPQKMSIEKLQHQIKSQYAKLAAFITFKSHSMESHCDSLKNLNAVSQILCNLSGFDKSTSIKISVLFISIQWSNMFISFSFSLLTWLTGSLKFVIRPARNDVFSSSDNALRTNQSKSCSEEVERSREMKQ